MAAPQLATASSHASPAPQPQIGDPQQSLSDSAEIASANTTTTTTTSINSLSPSEPPSLESLSPTQSLEQSLSNFTFTPKQDSQPEQTQNSLSSSPRRYPTGLTTPIPEEGDETESESPNEPVTPVSGRQSRDFHALNHHDPNSHYIASETSTLVPDHHADIPINQVANGLAKNPTIVQTAATPPPAPRTPQESATSPDTRESVEGSPESDQFEADATPLQRRSTRASSSSNLRRTPSNFSLTRKMTSFFRRSNSNVTESATREFRDANCKTETPVTSGSTPIKITPSSSRQFSFHKSSDTTRSNTPPSPSSPLEMARPSKDLPAHATMPSSGDFLDNTKKNRSTTGFSLRDRVNFAGNNRDKGKKQPRARSAERKVGKDLSHPWALAPEAGTGMKARRLSLSLPDDFTVDVTELYNEFEYQHKMFGRHGKHLGKGATSKVTLMVRKGAPGELYAVKEFRAKVSSETTEDYEKKIKSEYSIAKSLHHPNIVETIRLCTHHGRFNHVMEYASEGDLFSLVSKGYLKDESRSIDRFCLFKQLVQGVNYLHSNGIAHRDIKLENLLITKDSKLKITDFGVSEVFSGIHPGLREAGGECGKGMGDIRQCEPGICGSLPYIAPEVISKKGTYDPRALDVWSTAIVMIYLTFSGNLWGKAEVGHSGPAQQHYNSLVRSWEKFNALKARTPELPDSEFPRFQPFDMCVKPAALARVLMNMLNPDPAKRSTIADVINNRWVKNIQCCQLESYEEPKFIDVSKKDCLKSASGTKIFCHNHLPPQSTGTGLPPMPGKAGY